MRKILTVLLVAVLASAAAFAGVSFSGSFTAGYNANYNNDKWNFQPYGDDGENSEDGTLKLGIADDNGIWSANVMAIDLFDDSGDVDASLTVNFAKAIAAALNTESPVDASFSIGTHRYTTLRAYSNQSGNNFDRIRSVGGGYIAAAQVGYGDLIQVAASIDPGVGATSTSGNAGNDVGYGATTRDLTVSALTKPIDGIAVSVDYAVNGENKNSLSAGSNTNGVFGAAADINLGKLLGLDFNIGVSVAERYQFDDKYNVFAGTVYGGVDMVSAYVEYAIQSFDKDLNVDPVNYLHIGAEFALVENMNLDVYFGAGDLANFKDSYHVGGNIGYNFAGVTYNLGLEYCKGASYNYDYTGLSIVPSISVSF